VCVIQHNQRGREHEEKGTEGEEENREGGREGGGVGGARGRERAWESGMRGPRKVSMVKEHGVWCVD